mmetsp:Transcript_67065/g.112271  ORF Transcript_67065/g.112271 Transcript_67065/m.112271 type:complete len:372 (+) Transcript_67065:461-1576(+)
MQKQSTSEAVSVPCASRGHRCAVLLALAVIQIEHAVPLAKALGGVPLQLPLQEVPRGVLHAVAALVDHLCRGLVVPGHQRVVRLLVRPGVGDHSSRVGLGPVVHELVVVGRQHHLPRVEPLLVAGLLVHVDEAQDQLVADLVVDLLGALRWAQDLRHLLNFVAPGDFHLGEAPEVEVVEGTGSSPLGHADVGAEVLVEQLEAGGHIHGVAEAGVVHAVATPEVADEARPGVNAHAERDLRVPVRLPRVVQPEDGGLHRERGVDGVALLVVAAVGGVPHRHHSVPDELVDSAVAPHNVVAHHLEVLAADVGECLRVSVLADGAEALDVAEHDGQHLIPHGLTNLHRASHNCLDDGLWHELLESLQSPFHLSK